jgi:hypothetical protein
MLLRSSSSLQPDSPVDESIRVSHGKEICQSEEHDALEMLEKKALTIIVIGASGDLARKKIFPSLMGLECFGLLPHHTNIVGYSRSQITKVWLAMTAIRGRVASAAILVVRVDVGPAIAVMHRCTDAWMDRMDGSDGWVDGWVTLTSASWRTLGAIGVANRRYVHACRRRL